MYRVLGVLEENQMSDAGVLSFTIRQLNHFPPIKLRSVVGSEQLFQFVGLGKIDPSPTGFEVYPNHQVTTFRFHK